MTFSRRPSTCLRARGASPADATTPVEPADAFERACAAGFRMLAGRELSAAAVRDRLAARGFEPAIVEAVVERLTAVRALDEGRAVKAVAHTLAHVKRHGRVRAQRELEARGFAPDEAAAALADALSDQDERAAIERMLDLKLRGRSLDRGDQGAIRRLYAMLMRRGYASAEVREAIRRRTGQAPPLDDDSGDA
jgi:SOS response regulatory protein OraA/RecX